MKWEPWVKFKSDPELLPIEGPPCKDCSHWKPVRKFTTWQDGTINFDGVVLCQAERMAQDFSCFRSKDKVNGEGKL